MEKAGKVECLLAEINFAKRKQRAPSLFAYVLKAVLLTLKVEWRFLECWKARLRMVPSL